METDQTATTFDKSLLSYFWELRRGNHMKFTEKGVMHFFSLEMF